MSNAAKHLGPHLGIDVHVLDSPGLAAGVACGVRVRPVRLPVASSNISINGVIGFIAALGSTVKVNGVHKATAGTGGPDLHILLGVFSPLPKLLAGPQWDDELFMGSKTVLADGELSRLATNRAG